MNVWAASPVDNLAGDGPQRRVNHRGHGRNLRVIIGTIVGINDLLCDSTFFYSASWVSHPPFSRGLRKPDTSACLRWYRLRGWETDRWQLRLPAGLRLEVEPSASWLLSWL